MTLSRSPQAKQGKSAVNMVRPLLLILLFAIWWGGLTFYALIVVPIGSDVTSSVEQGFITQRVTFWHNLSLTLVTLCVIAEAFFRNALKWWLLSASLMIVNLTLQYMHWKLSGIIDASEMSVPSDFYRIHAVYLWLTTVEWLIGLAGVLICVHESTGCRTKLRSAQEEAGELK